MYRRWNLSRRCPKPQWLLGYSGGAYRVDSSIQSPSRSSPGALTGYCDQAVRCLQQYNSPVIRIGPSHGHVNDPDFYESGRRTPWTMGHCIRQGLAAVSRQGIGLPPIIHLSSVNHPPDRPRAGRDGRSCHGVVRFCGCADGGAVEGKGCGGTLSGGLEGF
ncbi:hypothetical protein BDW42DRAFT_9360 [Aspergillus taichungensis]|uniref:Uncharacterized protein n=1 Tax=Aspergillus taichungensis TaxID=482145 RepID=A0A2J5HIZ9_9EURO|nr:hypothetical protein BDW42DRAFT_9360 [Aspergillus taichungensis]